MPRTTKKTATKKTTRQAALKKPAKTKARKLINKVNAGRVARGAKPIPKRAYTRKPKAEVSVNAPKEVDAIRDVIREEAATEKQSSDSVGVAVDTQGRVVNFIDEMNNLPKFRFIGIDQVTVRELEQNRLRADLNSAVYGLANATAKFKANEDVDQSAILSAEISVAEARYTTALRKFERALTAA